MTREIRRATHGTWNSSTYAAVGGAKRVEEAIVPALSIHLPPVALFDVAWDQGDVENFVVLERVERVKQR